MPKGKAAPPFERFEVVTVNPCQFVVAIQRQIDITDDPEAQRSFIESAIQEALVGGWRDCKVELPIMGTEVVAFKPFHGRMDLQGKRKRGRGK